MSVNQLPFSKFLSKTLDRMLNPGGVSALMKLLAVSSYNITGSRAKRYGK